MYKNVREHFYFLDSTKGKKRGKERKKWSRGKGERRLGHLYYRRVRKREDGGSIVEKGVQLQNKAGYTPKRCYGRIDQQTDQRNCGHSQLLSRVYATKKEQKRGE